MTNDIRQFRKRHGITQKELADRLGITRQAVSQIENGESITINTLNKVAEAFNCSAFDLVKD